MGRTLRALIVLSVIGTLATAVGTAEASHPESAARAKRAACLQVHVGAQVYCKTVGRRYNLRIIRRRQVHEIQRTHVKFPRSYYRGWDSQRLDSAIRWETGRLKWLHSQPTWYPSDPVGLARVLAAERGWTGDEWEALRSLWMKESSFHLSDPNSLGCDGIPQACPASKMGPNWRDNARVQIEWGLGYIATRYGRPSAAWAHSLATDPGGWY